MPQAETSRKVVPIASGELDAELKEATSQIKTIREKLRRLYLREGDDRPWVIAYSGGKDSTLVLHLVFELLLSLPPKQRKRAIHVVSNDTLVESPLLIDHLKTNIMLIKKAANKLKVPVFVKLTQPAYNQTFWVNLIGKGYMPPTRDFRWCTDKMKISPTDKYLKQLCQNSGGATLMIGTRKQESQARRRNIEKRKVDADGMNPHASIKNCMVFTPIVELSDDQVWMILLQAKNHWGGSHRDMVTIYRNARGGECPTVLSKADAPSCGSTSPRFGCWTCTVVAKDRSLEGLVDSGYEIFEPLIDFRNWLQEIREDDDNRMSTRRAGVAKQRADGSFVKGPFTLEVRKLILDRLLVLQKETNRELISPIEIEYINDEWEKDAKQLALTNSFIERLAKKKRELELADVA